MKPSAHHPRARAHAHPRAMPRRGMLRRGFTLIEAVVTMTVLGAIGAVAASIIVNTAGGYSAAVTRAEVASDGAAALDRIWRELIDIPIKIGYGSVAPDISTFTATSVTWSTNSSLTLSGTNLMLTEAGGTARCVLAGVTSLTLQAYDESNTALGASLSGSGCDAIRRISIQFTVTGSGRTESFRTKLFLRATMSGASG
jgi:prepilin-type N-terminal cleavage/methylation domain-containing protein